MLKSEATYAGTHSEAPGRPPGRLAAFRLSPGGSAAAPVAKGASARAQASARRHAEQRARELLVACRKLYEKSLGSGLAATSLPATAASLLLVEMRCGDERAQRHLQRQQQRCLKCLPSGGLRHRAFLCQSSAAMSYFPGALELQSQWREI